MTWKTFLIRNQILAVLLLISIGGCSHGSIPRWDGKLYAGDSKRVGVTRAQSEEFISASDPKFDGGLWMSYADFRSFYSTYVLGCKEWWGGTSMMGPQEALDRFKIVVDQMQQEAARDGKPSN